MRGPVFVVAPCLAMRSAACYSRWSQQVEGCLLGAYPFVSPRFSSAFSCVHVRPRFHISTYMEGYLESKVTGVKTKKAIKGGRCFHDAISLKRAMRKFQIAAPLWRFLEHIFPYFCFALSLYFYHSAVIFVCSAAFLPHCRYHACN